jgi:centromere protein C
LNYDDEYGVTYTYGHYALAPNAIETFEDIGRNTMLFSVGACPPGSVEFAFGHPTDGSFTDPTCLQRLLPKKTDLIRIPPGNCYRMTNHSDSEAFVAWTGIPPLF